MSQIVRKRAGFIISHPFQHQVYQNISKYFEEPVYIVDRRKNRPYTYSDDFLSSLGGQVIDLATEELSYVDGLIDVVFGLTPIHAQVMFQKTKFVALQYSLAKEVYQYGLWRSIADLNVMYGNYSLDRVKGHCNAVIGGDARFDTAPKTAEKGSGILYMPTYGELSSLRVFSEALKAFPDDVNIRIKMHHSSEFDDADIIKTIASDHRVEILDGYQNGLDLIAAAEIVVSDYSGSMFDAIRLGKPTALIQMPVTQSRERTAPGSIEIARASEIGPIACDAGEVFSAIQRASDPQWAESRRKLVGELYAPHGEAGAAIAALVDRFLDSGEPPSLVLEGIRKTYTKLLMDNRALRQENRARLKEIKALKPGMPKARKPKRAAAGSRGLVAIGSRVARSGRSIVRKVSNMNWARRWIT